jgi:hypothetical protein
VKLNCGLSFQEKRAAAEAYYCDWHPYFAWFPIQVGEGDCRWLETIERKASYVDLGEFSMHAPFGCYFRARTARNGGSDG